MYQSNPKAPIFCTPPGQAAMIHLLTIGYISQCKRHDMIHHFIQLTTGSNSVFPALVTWKTFLQSEVTNLMFLLVNTQVKAV